MKKTLCILLTLILVVLSIPAAAADTAQDKISPELRDLLAQHPETGIENGVVVEIFHHNPNYPTGGITDELADIVKDNPKHSLTDAERLAYENNLKAQAELIGKIGKITYMEPDGFSLGRFYIGLPYESIEKVATLENVDYIDLPHDEGSYRTADEKIDDILANQLDFLSADSLIEVTLKLAYADHFYVGMEEPKIDRSLSGMNEEELNECLRQYDIAFRAYSTVFEAAKSAYYQGKNEEYADAVAQTADVDIVNVRDNGKYITAITKVSELEKIASIKEVDYIFYRKIVNVPNDDPHIYEDKFEQWMYSTVGARKFDYELSKSDPNYNYWNNYDYYDELYLTDCWALVYAEVNVYDPWEVVDHIRIGDRILSWYTPGAAVYPFGYFVYNAAEDTFYPIDRFVYPVEGYAHTDDGEFIKDENGRYVKEIIDPVISPDDYPGLCEALDELRIGRAVGDADGDGERTVLDATRIQRVKAGLDEAGENDLYETGVGDTSESSKWLSWSDADSDGTVTVMDATRIQRAVADLCDIDGAAKE